MAAFDPGLLEQAADAIFTEGCAKHFAAHSGRTGSVPKSSATLKRTGRSGVPRRTPIWQKSEGHRRFQLPPRQPAEPPCRLPCKKPAPPHHQHRPAASGFLPEPRDLGGNLLPIAHSEALKNPAIQKMAEKYGAPPLSSASAALWSWVRLPSPKPQIPPTWRTTPRWTFPFPLKARRP